MAVTSKQVEKAPCPKCGARSGSPCKNRAGYPTFLHHSTRVDMAVIMGLVPMKHFAE